MRCYGCNKTICDKPWIIYENEDGSVKNICGYLCSKNCPDITHYNYKHIKNPEDFTLNLIPIIPKIEELKLLSIDEISEMNNSKKTQYNNHLERMFEKDEGNIKLYEEHMVIEKSYQEQGYISNTYNDDDDDY